MKTKTLSLLGAAVLACGFGPAQEEFKLDDEGFIRNWLILAPIACENETSGATEIDMDQLKGEAKARPKAGDKATVRGKEVAWKAHKTPEHFIDFKEFVAGGQSEDVIGYAVCYVSAETELKDLLLKIGSNDQAKVYLNGKEVLKFTETRTLDKDQDSAPGVSLAKGQNVVVFKVINEKNNWQGCLRFTDKSGAALRYLKITLAPR